MIDEDVLGFEVAMEDAFGVDVGDSVEDLFEDDFDLFLVYFVVFLGDVLFEVEVVEVEDYFEGEFFGFVHDVEEGHDVGVFFQGFEEGYLSECGGGDAFFFPVELDVLDCD